MHFLRNLCNFYARIMQIMHNLCKNYASYVTFTQKLCKNYANYAQIMHKLCTLCINYVLIMHKLCMLCKNYAKITQKLRKKNYAKITHTCVNCIICIIMHPPLCWPVIRVTDMILLVVASVTRRPGRGSQACHGIHLLGHVTSVESSS